MSIRPLTTQSRATRVAAAAIVLAGLVVASLAHAADCPAADRGALLQEVTKHVPDEAGLSTRFFPGGHDGHLRIPVDDAKSVVTYRVLVSLTRTFWKDGEAPKAGLDKVPAERQSQTNDKVPKEQELKASDFTEAVVLATRQQADGSKTVDVDVLLPSSGFVENLWRYRSFWVFTCKVSGPPQVAYTQARVSDAGLSISIAIIGTLTLLFAVGRAAAARWRKSRDASQSSPAVRSLGIPQLLTAGPNGQASLGMFQLTLFTTVVILMISIFLLRTGTISALSQSVAVLVGIVSTGSLVGAYVNKTLTGVKPENIAWLSDKQFLPPRDTAPKPKFADLVTTGGNFDVYRFQTFAFSVFVAVALLISGFSGLADFNVDPNMMALLGLSQFAYVAGKTVTPKVDQLDDAITAARIAEGQLIAAAKAKDGNANPASEEQVGKLAPDEYKAYRAAFNTVEDLFRQIIGEPRAAAGSTASAPTAPASPTFPVMPATTRTVTIRLAIGDASSIGALKLTVDGVEVSVSKGGFVELPLEIGRAHKVVATGNRDGRTVQGEATLTPSLDDDGKPLALELREG